MIDAGLRCFTRVSVQRKDGTWNVGIHYNTRYWKDASFRDWCTSGD
ncbi:hypothetical protein [Microbacterium sp.]